MDTIGLSFQPGAEDEEQKRKAAMIPQAGKGAQIKGDAVRLGFRPLALRAVFQPAVPIAHD